MRSCNFNLNYILYSPALFALKEQLVFTFPLIFSWRHHFFPCSTYKFASHIFFDLNCRYRSCFGEESLPLILLPRKPTFTVTCSTYSQEYYQLSVTLVFPFLLRDGLVLGLMGLKKQNQFKKNPDILFALVILSKFIGDIL